MTDSNSMPEGSGRSQLAIKPLLPYLLLILISLPLLVYRLDTYPIPWFDEGFNTHVARTLEQKGIYGTYLVPNGFVPFDASVSAGPPIIVPIAVFFHFFGTNMLAARMVSVFFTLVALLTIYWITKYLYGANIALIAALLLLAFPPIEEISFLLIGRQALGEPAAQGIIVVGYAVLFLSWKKNNWLLTVLAGVLFGLGLLAKLQISFGLLPGLTLVAAAQFYQRRKDLVKLFAPIPVALLVIVAWMLVGQIATPAAVREQNRAVLLDGIQTHFLTDLLGRNITRGASILLGIVVVSVVSVVWRVLRRPKNQRVVTPEQWAEVTLATFNFCLAGWFFIFSIGWARYTYVALTFAVVLLSKPIWDVIQYVKRRLPGAPVQMDRLVVAVISAALILMAVVINGKNALAAEGNVSQQTADYISANVPANAVVESFEWELDALTTHWEIHHPASPILWAIIREVSHKEPVTRNYDVLEANPDYLIIGPFAVGTNFYQMDQVQANFSPLTSFGPYTIYKRIRN